MGSIPVRVTKKHLQCKCFFYEKFVSFSFFKKALDIDYPSVL
jgi:hypothetical protein